MSRSSERKRRGFSLGELCVFSLLLLMLVGGMYLIMVAGMRNVQQSHAYQTAQQQALIGIRSLVGELSNARANNNFLFYSPDTASNPFVTFLSGFPRYPAPQEHLNHSPTTGEVLWGKWVRYSVNPTNVLVRSELGVTGTATDAWPSPVAWPIPPIAQPGPFPSPAPNNAGKIIARNVAALYFEGAPNPPLGVVVTLYAQDATASNKITQVRYRVTAWMAN